MKLFSWKTKSYAGDADVKITGRRVAFIAERWNIGLTNQVQFENRGWADCGDGFYAGVTKRFKFGFFHVYYDGDHYALWFGPFYLNWSR